MANLLHYSRPVLSESPLNHGADRSTCLHSSLSPSADLKETKGVKVCFARAYFDTGVRKKVADCTYELPHTNSLSQLSCHTVKGKEQSSSFASCHFWVDKAVTSFFFWKFFISLSLPPPSLLSLSLQGPQAAVNFNTWCSNRCSLELCTHTQQAGNKDVPPPSLQPFNLKISHLITYQQKHSDLKEESVFPLFFSWIWMSK